jgi:hypothetical protein
MARMPAATAVAILSLAIGIAGNSVIFSVADALGMRPLRITDPEKLVRIEMTTDEDEPTGLSYDDLRDIRARVHGLAAVAGYEKRGAAASGNGRATEIVLLTVVTPNYFPMLGVRPAMGRAFRLDADDGAAGEGQVVMISHRFWQRWFGGDPAVVGKTVTLNQRSFAVIGVTAADFTGVEPQYAPDPSARATLDRLAASTGGAVYSENQLGSAGRKARAFLGSGPTVVQGERAGKVALAPYLAVVALFPFGLLLWRRDR